MVFLYIQGFKEEIDGLQEELDAVQNQGAELMTACGEPDKPVIKKSIDEVVFFFPFFLSHSFAVAFIHLHVAHFEILAMSMSHQVNSAWENLNKAWRERVERLEEAMQAAVQFQDGLQVFEESSLK